MLSANERTKLENEVLSGMLNFESFFLQVYEFNPNQKDLFRNANSRGIYLALLNSYTETGQYPTSPDVFSELLLHKASQEIKDHFVNNIHPSGYVTQFETVLYLIEDSIESDVKESMRRIEKQNIRGLEYAEAIREETDKIILEGFERYKKDERTNEQKICGLLNDIQAIKEGKAKDYIPTGFSKLDDAIIGLPKSHLTTIASRPGMGKTSFMLQLKRNLVDSGYKPLIISIEMTSDQLLIKDISAFSQIDSRIIESGQINEEENSKITEAANKLKEENYFIEDDGTWAIEKIKSTIRRYIIKRQIDIVFIDYLTLIHTPQKRDRYDLEIGEITNSLREFAKETGLPIVILSQLNRDCERRMDKKPLLSDLRESGSIEQNSKTVLFLFCPAYYGMEAEKKNWISKQGNRVSNEEYAEIIIAKARSGRTGIVSVMYRKEIHLFEDIFKEYPENNYQYGSIKSYYEMDDTI